jgi:hypothetical protein
VVKSTWTDIRMLCDGTCRWLWCAMAGEGVFKAGVATSRATAQANADRAVQHYIRREAAAAERKAILPYEDQMIDLDAMERGTQE